MSATAATAAVDAGLAAVPSAVRIEGARLPVVAIGAGEPVLFVHGALGDYRAWWPQQLALRHSHRAISYSRRQHFGSVALAPAAGYSRHLHAADLEQLLDALDVAPVHLVGHSYGASIAAAVALRRPDRVRSLVLADPDLLAMVPPADAAVLARHRRGLHDLREGTVRSGAGAGAGVDPVRGFFAAAIGGAGILDGLPAPARAVVEANRSTLAPMLDTYLDGDGFDPAAARALTVPTLLLGGADSPAIYGAILDGLEATVPDVARVRIETGHGLQFERPERFDQALAAHLRRCGSGPVRRD